MERFLTANEVANRLGVHVLTVYRLGKRGTLKVHKVGMKAVRFLESDIESLRIEHGIERQSIKQ